MQRIRRNSAELKQALRTYIVIRERIQHECFPDEVREVTPDVVLEFLRSESNATVSKCPASSHVPATLPEGTVYYYSVSYAGIYYKIYCK